MGGVCSRSTGSMEANPRKQLLMGKEWLLLNLRLACHAILSSDWKNERPRNNNAYVPTQKEHFANIVTHGVLVMPSFWLSYLMFNNATGPTQIYAAIVYGAVLTGLFTVSTVFHMVAAVSKEGIWKDLLHRSDRAMIYLFIAGSYTPWLNLRHLEGITVELRWAVWVLADQSGLAELQAGGAVYLFGVVFFKSDGVIPLAHAIWHIHVVVGAIIHYQAVN